MGVRLTSKEMHQKNEPGSGSNSGSVGLVSSLMKSWKISTKSSSHGNGGSSDLRVNSGNFDAMSKQQATAIRSSSSYSPMRHTPGSNASVNESPGPLLYGNHRNHHEGHSKKNGGYFKDLDEDWSAVIDDYNMPIPTIANGGISRANSNTNNSSAAPSIAPIESSNGLTRKLTSSSIKTNGSVVSGIANGQNIGYPQLPQLQNLSTVNVDEQEVENERNAQELSSAMQRIAKFDAIVSSKRVINQQELREISWNGIPKCRRPKVWKLLIGYLPANTKRQDSLCQRKRQEYKDGVRHIMSNEHERDIPTWHQIEIDIPRTNPQIKLYQFKSVQISLQRILYLWAIRHPASGYVQGINDIVTPFFQTFLTEYLPSSQVDDVDKLDPESYMTVDEIENLEADIFWCLTKLLEQITDNYIHGQPGILKQVKNLGQLVKRIDIDLYNHLTDEHVEFIQFAFRWMNCLLMREFKMNAVIRIWDTYLAETSLETTSTPSPAVATNPIPLLDPGPSTPTQLAAPSFQTPQSVEFSSPSTLSKVSSNMVINNTESGSRCSSLNDFHVFVCAAFLIKWSDKLIKMDFQEIITFLQNPPTSDWNENDIEMLLSEAFIWQSLYKDATSHWL